METYSRYPITLMRGEGSLVFDKNDKRYIDFLSGLSVLSLGHCPENLTRVLHDQIDRLWHVSNLYHIQPQEKCARLLVENSCLDQAFFCNSGTEAVEAALKLSRVATGEKKFIAMKQSFHGRTFGSLSVTGQTNYQSPFKPLLGEVTFVDFGNLKQVREALTEDIAAIIVEPMQAEGGLNLPPEAYLTELRELCDQSDTCLIFDEVQVGMGRLGSLFAYEYFNVEPDILCLAKGLGGGFPIGAMLAKRHISQHFQPGHHASTFGGGPLATTVACEMIESIKKPEFLKEVRKKGEWLSENLKPHVGDTTPYVRHKGMGMLQGLECRIPVGPLVQRCLEDGLLVGPAGQKVLRLAPALNCPWDLLEEGMNILTRNLKNFKS